MADSGIQAFQGGTDVPSAAPIPFRFEVTWNSITCSLSSTSFDLSPRQTVAPHTNLPPRRQPVHDADAREWEMVLPRMRRPEALATAAPRQLLPPIAAPQFMAAAEPAGGRRSIGIGAAILLLAAGAAAYGWIGQRGSQSQDLTTISGAEMSGAGWVTEWAAGSSRGRQLTVYRPSISMSDYRLDFLGAIERKSLGWVFRAADSNNYYAAKLEAAQPGGQLTITRFAVTHGFEGSHIQRILSLPGAAGGMLKVRLEARGPRFTVSVQNQVVEDWEDDRLKSGGLGFLNEREEQGRIGSIQIAFSKGGAR